MRLIDADTLKEKFKDREGDDFTVFHFYDAIDNAPTVLHDNYSMGYQDGVKKVLSERPKGDLISREALRNVILNDRKLDGVNANWEVNRILVHIDNAPTVDVIPNEEGYEMYGKGYCKGYLQGYEKGKNERPQGEWIPVSERLPDVSQRYLVYTKYDEVMTDFFMGDEFMQGDDIIAWQPLPEPYKKEGAE